MYIPKTYEWFKERIGKRIYRDADSCDCASCRKIVEEGIVVSGEMHADFLSIIDYLAAKDGIYYNYRDTA